MSSLLSGLRHPKGACANIIRLHFPFAIDRCSAKSLFDYLNYYSRQSDALAQLAQPTQEGKALFGKLEELEQKIKAQIEEMQKDLPHVQEAVRGYLAKKSP